MGPMTARGGSTGVGARLKGLREGKRVTLRQIAASTKISVPSLEAIERDDVRKLPGGIFGRSFVRSYARELGLNPDDTAREFFAQFPDVTEAEEATVDRTSAATARERALALLSVAGVIVPVVALGVWFYAGRQAPATSTLPAARISAASPEVPPPMPARAAADAVPALGSVPADPAGEGPLTLHVVARSDCWVSVIADGREVVARLFTAGDEEAVRAGSELRVKVGDATAVSLRLNGMPVRPLGRSGQVVSLRIDAENASQWLDSH
jgi:cytoskeleton protein RodZ